MSLAQQEYIHSRPVKCLTIAAVAVTSGTAVAVWTPAAGKSFRLLGFVVSLTVGGSVIFKDGATEFARTGLLAANSAFQFPSFGNGYLSLLPNNALNIDVSATGSVSGFVFGYEE